MGSTGERTGGVPLDGLVKAVVGYGGLAMCLTLVFLGMRSVMDVGGACADGGPYVSAQSCPPGSPIALMGGIFLGVAFALVATVGGSAVGGIWSSAPLLAWSGLFGSLGWNFMDYGVFNAPTGAGIDVGGAICGITFWIMAAGPLLILLPAMRPRGSTAGLGRSHGGSSSDDGLSHGGSSSGDGSSSRPAPASDGDAFFGVATHPGSGQPAHRPIVILAPGSTATTSRADQLVTSSATVVDGDLPEALRAQIEALERQLGMAGAPAGTEEAREELARIAADFGAAIGGVMAETPMAVGVVTRHANADGTAPPAPTTGPGTGSPGTAAPDAPGGPEPEFTEGTQALLDRLERLADMRDRGLLGAAEYETAKAAIMAELEGRS